MKFEQATILALKKFNSKEFENRITLEDPKMTKEIPILRKINENGFLTFESQAGNFQKGLLSERAYILGFMQREKAISFLRKMSLSTDKNAICIIPVPNDTEIDPNMDIPLSIYKNEIFTYMSTVLPESEYHDNNRKSLKLNKKDIVMIFCWDGKWNRYASGKNGLFTNVLSILGKQL